MKRITTTILFSAMACGTLFAQPIVENLSSSSAVVVRDPARQSSTEVDAAIYNPAGTAFVKEGLSFSVSGIANFGQTKANDGTKSYKINENYVMPSVQVAFKKDKWAFSGSFASEGGYRRNYKNGSPIVDGFLMLRNEGFKSYSDYMSGKGYDGYSVSVSQSSAKSHLYNWTIRLGAAYKVSEHLSAYAGAKLNRVSWQAKPNLSVYHNESGEVDITEESINDLLTKYTYTESGWGIAPVFGLDYKGKTFNIGMKYEFGSHINIGDGEDFTLPAVMSLGGNYQALRWLNVAVGGDLYFKSAGNPFCAFDDNLYWDAAVSATFTCNKSLTANIGYQLGKQHMWGEDFIYRVGEENGYYGSVISKLTAGIRYAFTDRISVDLGVTILPQLKTNYIYSLIENGDFYTNDYEELLYSYSGNSSPRVSYKRTPIQVALGFNYGL